ncbi:MAG: hypothetical protein PHS95_00245 [Candidatus Pacebacteria bacterium]|nr:hypothetical protein [Candidatus Paceibacterota bacterium]
MSSSITPKKAFSHWKKRINENKDFFKGLFFYLELFRHLDKNKEYSSKELFIKLEKIGRNRLVWLSRKTGPIRSQELPRIRRILEEYIGSHEHDKKHK